MQQASSIEKQPRITRPDFSSFQKLILKTKDLAILILKTKDLARSILKTKDLRDSF